MNATAPTRHIRLAGTHNLRDLGGYPTAGGTPTAWRRLLRSDGLHALTAADIARLREIGLRTVIDLRGDGEAQHQPNRLAAEAGFVYARIPLFDALSPVELALAGRDFDLGQRYLDAIGQCGAAFARVLTAIAEADSGVVLFHCTVGKDRTGLIAALLLGLAGVADEAIAADYALTATLADPLLRNLRDNAVRRGRAPQHVDMLFSSPPAVMHRVLARIRDDHGGFDAYVARIGVEAALRDRLRQRLAPPAAEGSPAGVHPPA